MHLIQIYMSSFFQLHAFVIVARLAMAAKLLREKVDNLRVHETCLLAWCLCLCAWPKGEMVIQVNPHRKRNYV